MSLGLKEDSKLQPEHYTILTFVTLNILMLLIFPMSKRILKKAVGITGLISLILNLLWIVYLFLIEGICDRIIGGFITVIFGCIDIILIKEIVLKIKTSKSNSNQDVFI